MTNSYDVIAKALELIEKIDSHISSERKRAACIRHHKAGDVLSPECRGLLAPRADEIVIDSSYPKFTDYMSIYFQHKGSPMKDAFGNLGYTIKGNIANGNVFREMMYNKQIAKWNGVWFFTQNAIKSFEGKQPVTAAPPTPPQAPQPPEVPKEAPKPPVVVATPPPQPAPQPVPVATPVPTQVPPQPVQQPAVVEEERIPPPPGSVNVNSPDIRNITLKSQRDIRYRYKYNATIKYFGHVLDANCWELLYHPDGFVSFDIDEEDMENKDFKKMVGYGFINKEGYITEFGAALIPEYENYVKMMSYKRKRMEERIAKIPVTLKYTKKSLLEDVKYVPIQDSNDVYSAIRSIRAIIPHLDVDYSPFDVKIANSCNHALAETNALFPQIMKKLKHVGNSYHVNSRLGVRSKSSSWAKSFAPGMFSGGAVSWNARLCNNYKRLQDGCKKSMNSGFHPAGSDNVDSVMHHELGHQLDYGLVLSHDATIVQLYKNLSRDDIIYGVSGYAGKKFSEFIAEAWCEYMTNPTPRPIAQMVGDAIVTK